MNSSRSTSPTKEVGERPSSHPTISHQDASIQFPTPYRGSTCSKATLQSTPNDGDYSDSDLSTEPEDTRDRSSLAGRLLATDDGSATPKRTEDSIVKPRKIRVLFALTDSSNSPLKTPAKSNTNPTSTESNEESKSGCSDRAPTTVHFSLPGEKYPDDGSGTPSRSKLREGTPYPNKRPKRKTKTPSHLETDYELSTRKKGRR